MFLETKELNTLHNESVETRYVETRYSASLQETETKEMLLALGIGFTALVLFIGAPLLLLNNRVHAGFSDTSVHISETQLLALTNSERTKAGLENLAINAALKNAAYNKALSLTNENYFSHTAPSGEKFSSWIKNAHYNYSVVGENLASDFSENQTVVDAWMNSPKHKENILNSQWKDTAIAVMETNDGRKAIVVELFGAPQ
jgi:uncharacterized protein YkwD